MPSSICLFARSMLGALPNVERGAALLTIDGSHGEGGGQVLRTALALAVTLGRPVHLTAIRIRRPKPGLRPQHLAVVRALAAIGDAEVEGDAPGGTELRFTPRTLRGGEHRFDIGAVQASAGSVSLLFQALLLPLLFADTPSRLTLVGGTHVPWSPPVPYLTTVFLPALAALGIRVDLVLQRWGWYPAGRGVVEAAITPAHRYAGLRPRPPAPDEPILCRSAVSRLPRSIAERQAARARERLADAGLETAVEIEVDATAVGPGTSILLARPGRAGFSALGRRGLPAEQVADAAVEALLAYLASGALIDDHLADQLLAILALADGTSELTCPTVSSHLGTVAWVIDQFLPGRTVLTSGAPARVRVRGEGAPGAVPSAPCAW
jgi:RNA 3'-terminal phosphate cyclase (ATP)